PGGWEGDPMNAFTPEGRTAEQTEYFEFSKKVFNWRKSKSVIHSGKTMHFVPENNVYVYFRYNSDDKVMVIINNNPEVQTLDLKRFGEMIGSATNGKEMLSQERISLENTLTVEGKTS